MRTKIMLLLALIGLSLTAPAKNASIAGQVINEKKEPIINAVIQVFQQGHMKGGTVTDYDGKYKIDSLLPGSNYEIKAMSLGYITVVRQNVILKKGVVATVNFNLSPQKKSLKEIQIVAYKQPLIQMGKPSGVLGREDIKHVGPLNAADLVPIASPGIYHGRPAGDINAFGGRASAAQYYEDGVTINAAAASFPIGSTYLDPSEETYKKEHENDFMNVKANPLSTMSVDVDRASYSNVRRFINIGQKPPTDAVRVEEMINYFNYDYPQPRANDPVAMQTELIDCPWEKGLKLLRIGIQARTIDEKDLPPSNLVFLIDVSGSMGEPNKLPLVQSSLQLLVKKLRKQDKVAIVVYAGSAGLVLPSTYGDKKEEIMQAINRLHAGGSTAGGEGIQLAYKIAQENFIPKGNNRVLLATDGDFNVGVSGENELEDLITKEREKGVFLTCLGYGMGNYKDSKMEVLADKGNGNYDYIDDIQEAEKTLVQEFGGTLFTVAKDVKAQIEFNPKAVQAYRLVGYENRLLNEEDFKDDKKDAGDMGSGHSVTILYEIVPVGVSSKYVRSVNELKYQLAEESDDEELATVKFRYKKPDGDKSREIAQVIENKSGTWRRASENTRFAASVAMFGLMLKNSEYKGSSNYQLAQRMAESSLGDDENGYRDEFVKMIKTMDEYDSKTTAR